ncbi:MAG: hypothetical protein U0744_01105 [Gemmataceae bacterium]
MQRLWRKYLERGIHMSDPKSAVWSVHRQDDNGNQFVVASGLTEENSLRLAEESKQRGHKQLYRVSPDGRAVAESNCPRA